MPLRSQVPPTIPQTAGIKIELPRGIQEEVEALKRRITRHGIGGGKTGRSKVH